MYPITYWLGSCYTYQEIVYYFLLCCDTAWPYVGSGEALSVNSYIHYKYHIQVIAQVRGGDEVTVVTLYE